MFLCRVASKSVRVPRATTFTFRTTRSLFTTHRILNSPAPARAEKSNGSDLDSDASLIASLPIVSWTPSRPTYWVSSRPTVPRSPRSSQTAAYLELRNRHREALPTLPHKSWTALAQNLVHTGNVAVALLLVEDAIKLSPLLRYSTPAILQILISTPDKLVLPTHSFLHIAQFFQKWQQFQSDTVQEALVVHYAALLSSESLNSRIKHANALAALILPLLHRQIDTIPPPPSNPSLQYRLSPVAQAAFVITNSLLRFSKGVAAKDVLRALAKAELLPLQALRHMKDDSNTAMRLTLVATAHHWRLRLLAVYLARDALSRPLTSASRANVAEVVMEIVPSLLNNPNALSLRACGYLIREMHPLAPVPVRYIRDFYRIAAEYSEGDAAQSVYAWSRQPTLMQTHRYPPPPPEALWFLLRQLESSSAHSYLHRILACEVADDDLSIPSTTRANFILSAADKGYALPARRIWERYAVGDNKAVVTGNAALMLKMVRLFQDLTTRAQHVLDFRDKDPMQHNAPLVDENILRQRADDLDQFTHRVIDEYVEANTPLAEAHHYVLTTLARAYMVVGQFADGFAVLRQLLERKEELDQTDINVALSGLAEQHPRLAAGLIDRMRQKGLSPDETMLGTILHAAKLHEDGETVNLMVDELQTLRENGQQLSSATLTNMLRACAEPVEGLESTKTRVVEQARETLRAKLSSAWDLLSKAEAQTKERIGPQTGKQLVLSALRAKDASLAFDFWRETLAGALWWDDREHRFLRQLIENMLTADMNEQRLDEEEGLAMIRHLQGGQSP
ncbi:hypothetical protein BD626DRAFT_263925 [Schizophyllum amplum]|uniref:Pentacotripeptide-repeat region of PRORP domain-containing protein n=1 Tax=Schizophyllum amplum TaxID=97359 RepID=A0A550CGQ4_9AGAR|nr:hypothetical protein BD626DRAFT_263925 [Auriculariopsis ampla]